MNVIQTKIPDVLIFEPKVFGDERGFFYESYNQKVFEEKTGNTEPFVQDNHSKSNKNVLRGLHIQKQPFSQGKLVRCISGEIFDVAVDLRENSPSFGKWVGITLSAENQKQLWIPKGFAHGFIVLSESAEFVYKCIGFYSPESELSIKWDDPDLDIKWPVKAGTELSLSNKDMNGLTLKQYLNVMRNEK